MYLSLSLSSLGTQKITELNQKATLATSSTEEHGTSAAACRIGKRLAPDLVVLLPALFDACAAISNELALVIESCNKNAANAKAMLELLKKESGDRKKDKATPLSEIRIRENMCATLTKKFMDCMKEYQKAQVRALGNLSVLHPSRLFDRSPNLVGHPAAKV